MKTPALLLAASIGWLAHSHAVEAPKQPLQVTVKKQVLDSDHDAFGHAGRSREKAITLRVVLFNTSRETVGESVLTGTAIVSRAGDFKERIVREPLGELKVPAMKPNEKITLDLGKIELREVEWGKTKFEETLEEWQVTCSQGAVEIGKAVSGEGYAKLEKEAASSESPRRDPLNRGPRKFPRR